MGRESDAGGWLEYFHAATQAWLDDQVTRGRLPASVKQRGWKGALAKELGVYDVQISRWVDEDAGKRRTPDVESCRKLAKVWGRPPLEVLVAAGHLDPSEVNLPGRPKPPTKPLPPDLQRLALLLDSNAPEDVKARIRAMITAAADLGELSSSTERPTGRSA